MFYASLTLPFYLCKGQHTHHYIGTGIGSLLMSAIQPRVMR